MEEDVKILGRTKVPGRTLRPHRSRLDRSRVNDAAEVSDDILRIVGILAIKGPLIAYSVATLGVPFVG